MWIAVFTFLVFMTFYSLRFLGSLKCLMTPGVERIETTNSLLLWVSFLNLFFHAFVKHQRDLRLKYVLFAFAFLYSKFYLSTYDDIVHLLQ